LSVLCGVSRVASSFAVPPDNTFLKDF
jgi:hypothetical protein